MSGNGVPALVMVEQGTETLRCRVKADTNTNDWHAEGSQGGQIRIKFKPQTLSINGQSHVFSVFNMSFKLQIVLCVQTA